MRGNLLDVLRDRAHPLARIGCVAIGTVYTLIGSVALVALTGHLIEYADPTRIGRLLRRVPGGDVLLWSIAVGAAAYVAWRLIEAITDPYEALGGWGGVAKRAGVALSGLMYVLLAESAARMALRAPSGPRDATEKQQQLFIAHVLRWHWGAWMLAAAGIGVIAVGIVQFWMVVRRSYAREIRMQPETHAVRRVLEFIGAYGYSARGVILCVLGYFLVRGALAHNPRLVGDTDTAFDFIGGGIVGNTAFALVAIGTIAYGIFMYANAWLYRFDATPGTATSRERA